MIFICNGVMQDLVEYYQDHSLGLTHLDIVLKYAYYMITTPPKTTLQLPWPVYSKGSSSSQTDFTDSQTQVLHVNTRIYISAVLYIRDQKILGIVSQYLFSI